MSDLKLVPPIARSRAAAARPKLREESREHFARLARPGVGRRRGKSQGACHRAGFRAVRGSHDQFVGATRFAKATSDGFEGVRRRLVGRSACELNMLLREWPQPGQKMIGAKQKARGRPGLRWTTRDCGPRG